MLKSVIAAIVVSAGALTAAGVASAAPAFASTVRQVTVHHHHDSALTRWGRDHRWTMRHDRRWDRRYDRVRSDHWGAK
jgi:hypothetical protein